MGATPGLGRYRALKRDYDAHEANVSNPHSVTAAQLGLTGPMDYKGNVAAAANFPTLATVLNGDTYRCSSPCTDNDATKTNTLQSFVYGELLTWNGTGWDVFEGDLTPAAQIAGAGAVGVAIPITAGAGSAAATAVAAAVGGALTMAGGAGGASDGTDLAAAGGAASLTAGAGGAAHTAVVGGIGATATVAGGAGGAGSAGAAGGAGGNALINAGAGGVTGGVGAGANGNVLIGSATTAAIELGNVTDNPGVQVLGTGNINLLGGGALLHPDLVRVTIVATGGTGGVTAGTISVQVSDLAGTAINRAVKLRLDSSLTQFAGSLAATGTGFFGAATAGVINIGTGGLFALVTTDATGLYEGALANAADETCWFSATHAPGGFANAAEGCIVVECIPNDATWSA